MSSPAAEPPAAPLRSLAALHAEVANACLADRGIIEITIAHLIAARQAPSSAPRLQAMLEETKNTLRHSIERFESFQNFSASMKLLALLYAVDPSVETLTFVLERLRASQQMDMAEMVEKMLEERKGQSV